MITSVEKSNDGKHKWVAHFKNGRSVRFGAVGYTDYTLGAPDEKRAAYRARHKKDLVTRDPYKPGYLSMYLLWGDSRDMNQNVREYNKRFF